MGKLSSPSIFISYSGKTLSLPSFSLMWNTKSLLGPLKAREINISVLGPKKMNVPFIFSYSLAGDFKKAETYLKLQDLIFYTRGMELQWAWWQKYLYEYLSGAWSSKQTLHFTAGEWCQVCRSQGRRIQPPIFWWADQRHHISLFQENGNGKIKGWRKREIPLIWSRHIGKME